MADVVAIYRQGSPFPTASKPVFPPIAIDVKPGPSGPQLAQLERQQRLPGIVVERIFVVRMLKQTAHVFEERWSVRAWKRQSVGAWERGAWSVVFVDFPKAIRLYIRHGTPLPASPSNFDRHAVGRSASREGQQRFRTGQITPTT